jgi:hypothetical protein
MRRGFSFFLLLLAMAPTSAGQGIPASSDGTHQRVDGIAILIENDIVTDSEVQELASFQQLVNGKAKSRAEMLDELVDQWIVRNNAESSAFAGPSDADVNGAVERFMKKFPHEQLSAVGLTPKAVQHMVKQELYLSRFLDFRFRSSTQVDDKDIEQYYQSELLPQLQVDKRAAPPLEEVREQIREVLTQRDIDRRAQHWLGDTRSRLHLEMNTGSVGR